MLLNIIFLLKNKSKDKRLKIIVNKYDNTIFVEEALHRLVEIHII